MRCSLSHSGIRSFYAFDVATSIPLTFVGQMARYSTAVAGRGQASGVLGRFETLLDQLRGNNLKVQQEILRVLDEVLSLDGRVAAMRAESPLLGAIPELDSMAVVSLITTLEERFGFTIADDELDASAFTTVGSLTHFVSAKLSV